MKHVLELMRLEIKKQKWFFIGYMAVVVGLQLFSALWAFLQKGQYLENGQEVKGLMEIAYGNFKSDMPSSFAALFVLIAGMVFVGKIWEGDFRAKGKWGMRLLSLPVKRSAIYWSKTIVAMMFATIAFGVYVVGEMVRHIMFDAIWVLFQFSVGDAGIWAFEYLFHFVSLFIAVYTFLTTLILSEHSVHALWRKIAVGGFWIVAAASAMAAVVYAMQLYWISTSERMLFILIVLWTAITVLTTVNVWLVKKRVGV